MSQWRRVKRKSIVNQVLEQLLEKISSGEYSPGTKLPSENELAEQMGVSRFTVRSALQHLLAWNFTEVVQGEGTMVKEPSVELFFNPVMSAMSLSPSDVEDLLQLRRGVERVSAELAAQNACDSDIARLGACLARMGEALDKGDRDEFARFDYKFHLCMAGISGNAAIHAILVMMESLLMKHFKETHRIMSPRDGLYYHQQIFDAIACRDIKEAGRAVERNMSDALELLYGKGECDSCGSDSGGEGAV